MKYLLFLSFLALSALTQAQQTIKQYLSGTDKDHTVPWQFMVNNGRNSGKWGTIPVPSCWEMQGYGTYSYSRDLPDASETGMYKYNFSVSPAHKGKTIKLVFEASMTDTDVKINGRSAGVKHLGGFYEFSYDVTSLLKYDAPNLLEVTVTKKSENNSVNRAERQSDFWLFGGIFRPVYLEILPANYIERVAIDAKADGLFTVHVKKQSLPNQTLEAQVFDLAGKPVDKAFSVGFEDTMLSHQFSGIKTWNPEAPALYNVVVSLKEGTKIIHSVKQRFGFRTVELRELDGFYVNGKKVIFKGVCRHSEWPESGRTLSRSVHLMDIAAIKGMNMNAVRMSHYPPDKEFLDLCDSLGLFVLDELTGWQKAYDTVSARRLVRELVERDVNHPSIVIWDNGNEGGWNRGVDKDYALYDPQKRHVIHPWERFNGTNTKHYPDYKYIQTEVANPKEVFFPTEFMHGLFDGGHGAALEDFWNEMLKHPHLGGGFLWALHDEGVVRADRHDSIDVAGNLAPDGIVGPHREREGSYYTIRELWSPVYIELTKEFKGTVEVENRYIYSTLANVRFSWKYVRFPQANDKSTKAAVVKSGTVQASSVAPGEKTTLTFPQAEADAFLLTALGAKGDTISTWSWQLKQASAPSVTRGKDEIKTIDDAQTLKLYADGVLYYFDKKSGTLTQVQTGSKKTISFAGPLLASGTQKLRSFEQHTEGNKVLVQPRYEGDSLEVTWIFESGKLPVLQYSYLAKDTTEFMGISFNYPEEKISGMKYLGRGPYRVWKNRLKGPQIGIWQKKYNNTITGENWDYPEFKGYFSALNWMQLQGQEGSFVVYANEPGMYLQVLKPARPVAAPNSNTVPAFPSGAIGIMHAIPPIGTKFNRPDVMGPQSQRNYHNSKERLKGSLSFDFR